MSSSTMQPRRGFQTSDAADSSQQTNSTSAGSASRKAALGKQAPRELLSSNSCATLLVPGALVICAHGGHTLLGLVSVGLMIAYLLESSQNYQGSFGAWWVTLVSVIIGMVASSLRLLRHSVFAVFLVYNMLALIFLIGIWGSFQLRWFKTQSLALRRVAERVLLGALHGPSPVVLTWGLVALTGADHMPFYLQLVLFAHHFLLSLPQQASFEETSATHAIGPFESGVHLVALYVQPMVSYVCLYYRVLHHPEHLANLLVLYLLPFVYLWLVRHRGPLQFCGLSPEVQRTALNLCGILGLGMLTGCFEYRVVFGSFGHYIVFPAPFSYIVVTAALYSGLALLLLHIHGTVDLLFSDLCLYLSVFAALACSLVVGLPLLVVPFPVIGTYSGFLFYAHRQLSQFLVLAVSAAVVAAWLLWHAFWFLEFQFSVRELPLQLMCVLLWFLVSAALVAIGLLIRSGRTTLEDSSLGGLPAGDQPSFGLQLWLVLQAAGLLVGEKVLLEQPEGMYPPGLMLLSSGLGVAMSHRLVSRGLIEQGTGWVLLSLSVGKLTALLDAPQLGLEQQSQSQSLWITLHGVLLVLVVLPVWCAPKPAPGLPSMPGLLGALHAASILVVTFMCRTSIFARVAALAGQPQPSDVLLTGSFLLVAALCLLPLSCVQLQLAFPELKLVNLFLLGMGAVLLLVQPPMQPHVFSAMLHGEALAPPGEYTAQQLSSDQLGALWAPWLLTLALGVAVGVLTGVVPIPRSKGAKLVLCASFGMPLGASVAGFYLPFHWLISTQFGIVCSLAVCFMALAVAPVADLHLQLPWLFSLFITMLPVTWMSFQLHLSHPRRGSGSVDYLATARGMLLSGYAAIGFSVALMLKVGGATPAHRAGPAHLKAQTGAQWLARAGNYSVLLCYCAATTVNAVYLDGSEGAQFMLAAVFLLLQSSGTPLESAHRYFSPVLVSSGSACCIATTQMHLGFITRYLYGGAEQYGSSSWLLIAKNTALLLCTLPSHYHTLSYLWTQASHSSAKLWLLLPLNVLCVALCDLSALRLLSAAGLVYGLLLHWTLHTVHKTGQRIL